MESFKLMYDFIKQTLAHIQKIKKKVVGNSLTTTAVLLHRFVSEGATVSVQINHHKKYISVLSYNSK